MTRSDQIVALLAEVGRPLGDHDIGTRLGINPVYVNAICRRLADAGVVVRGPGSNGTLVNRLAAPGEPPRRPSPAATPARPPRVPRAVRARRNVDALVASFAPCVDRFERTVAFPGPSLYFHERAIERRRQHGDAHSLVADHGFLEYLYAVLPSWGMHRMGNLPAKVVDFDEFAGSFRALADPIQALWDVRLTDIAAADADRIGAQVWHLVEGLRVSRSDARIVAGSKALHHALPDLVPPIDRQYTFRFFTGQKLVNHGEARAFAEWFPHLCEIGRRCRTEIEAAVARGGYMATGPAKVVDNAIVGFMQGSAAAVP